MVAGAEVLCVIVVSVVFDGRLSMVIGFSFVGVRSRASVLVFGGDFLFVCGDASFSVGHSLVLRFVTSRLVSDLLFDLVLIEESGTKSTFFVTFFGFVGVTSGTLGVDF